MKPYSENKKLKVIEMIAGPGAGKSTAALFLAAHMKARGYKVEYVHEIPKDLYWDGRNNGDYSMFTEQDVILAQQNNLFRRMLAHDVDYVVTDTSLLLGLVYAPSWFPRTFDAYLQEVRNSYHNITFFVDRGDIPYVEEGRNQTEQQAQQVDLDARNIIRKYDVDYFEVVQQKGVYDSAALQMLRHIQGMETTAFVGHLAGGR